MHYPLSSTYVWGFKKISSLIGMRSKSLFYESENFIIIEHDTAIGAVKGVNTRKAADSDSICGWILKFYNDVSASVFTSIF